MTGPAEQCDGGAGCTDCIADAGFACDAAGVCAQCPSGSFNSAGDNVCYLGTRTTSLPNFTTIGEGVVQAAYTQVTLTDSAWIVGAGMSVYGNSGSEQVEIGVFSDFSGAGTLLVSKTGLAVPDTFSIVDYAFDNSTLATAADYHVGVVGANGSFALLSDGTPDPNTTLDHYTNVPSSALTSNPDVIWIDNDWGLFLIVKPNTVCVGVTCDGVGICTSPTGTAQCACDVGFIQDPDDPLACISICTGVTCNLVGTCDQPTEQCVCNAGFSPGLDPLTCAADNTTLELSVTYDHVPATSDGLNYAGIAPLPVRGARVEVRNGAGGLLTTVETSDDGTVSVPNVVGDVQVWVYARSPDPPIRVQDNTADDAVYVMTSSTITIDNGVANPLAMHADSGYDSGTGDVTNPRVAAPFSILDTVYGATTSFLAERPDATFAECILNWSVDNRMEDGDKALGQIGTAHWDGAQLYLRGLLDSDTDEYDDSVTLHEYGHYFEDTQGRSDSMGGYHAYGTVVDPRLAWGEGWATAFGVFLSGSTEFIDTYGTGQATASAVDLEDNLASDPNPGWYSEASGGAIVYDLFDNATEAHDNVAIGLGGMFDLLTGPAAATEAYMTLLSFVNAAKAAHPADAAAIDNLTAHHLFGPVSDDFGTGETADGGLASALPIYHQVAIGGGAVTVPFYGADEPECDATDSGTDNKEETYNRVCRNRLLWFVGNGNAVTVQTAAGTGNAAVQIHRIGEYLDGWTASTGDSAAVETTADATYTIWVLGEEITGSHTIDVVVTDPEEPAP